MIPVPQFPQLKGLTGEARKKAIDDILRGCIADGGVFIETGYDEEFMEKKQSEWKKKVMELLKK
jgi:hypothetical protein